MSNDMRSVFAWVVWAASTVFSDAIVEVDFSHTYTGVAAETQNTGNITLAFSVYGSGNVTLDASCADPDPARFVNEFDKLVGTVTDPAMRGRTFTIVLSSTGSGNLRIDNTGEGLAIQGGNSQIIDANSEAINEVITATVAVAGSQFNLLGVDYVGRAGGAGMKLSDTIYTLSTSTGTVDVSAQGVSGNFTVASSASAVNQGFVLSGLTFDMVATGNSSFDNGAGNKLWTAAANWDPDSVPVAPQNAEIAGYDVIINSAVANGPAELKIINGSLTVSGSGALSMKSMVIGRNIEKVVRLLIDGSGVSFGYS